MNQYLTSIIMPMHNHIEYSKIAIDSLYRNTNKDDFELICIDDASTDGTGEYLDSLDGIKVIHFKENVGFDRAVNAGIKAAKGEYTAVLNNDLILTPFWLPQLITVLESDPHIGMVVPACNASSNYQIIYAPYTNVAELEQFALKYNHSDPMKWQERMRLIFYAVLFRTRELKAFGGMDEQFSPGGFEDDDLSLRYRRAGYRLIFTTDTYIHHFCSVTTSETGLNLLMSNREKFYEKHKIHSWELCDIYMAIVEAYDFPKRSTIRLLGVGSRAGATLQHLKSLYKQKYRVVPTMDYLCKDPVYLEDASTICEHAELYEKREAFFEKETPKYDVILVEDVVEKEALEDELKSYEKFLNPKGDLILLFPKGEVALENTDCFKIRYQKELGEYQFCVFTKKCQE